MSNEQLFSAHLSACFSQIKDANIQPMMKPEDIKIIFKKVLSLKNPYWEMNNDSDKITKICLIFKPDLTYRDKGKPIYTGILFNEHALDILLEEQYARNEDNTFEISYQLIFNNWPVFQEQLTMAFTKAHYYANGNRALSHEALS